MPKLTPDKGLKLEPDNTPLSGSMTEDAELIDEILYVSATGAYWYYHYCYGLDLGSPQTVDSIICRATYGATHTPTSWYGTSWDSVMVYKSDDGSSWTEVEQFDGPPIIHKADMEVAFELEFASSQTARFFKVRNAESSSTLATNPGAASLMVSEIEAYGTGGEQTQLEDISLDLASYYRKSEDLAAFLRAHDGVEFRDLSSKLAAFLLHKADLPASLSAWYQRLANLGLNLKTWATGYRDLASLLIAYGEGRQDLRSALNAAKMTAKDLAVLLTVTGGIVLNDLGVFMHVTDGEVKNDAALILRVVSGTPAFRTVTAQRVASIVHEV